MAQQAMSKSSEKNEEEVNRTKSNEYDMNMKHSESNQKDKRQISNEKHYYHQTNKEANKEIPVRTRISKNNENPPQ